MTSEFKKGFLWAKPNAVSASIVKAIDKKKSEVYAPKFWRVVMALIIVLPNFVFKRIKL